MEKKYLYIGGALLLFAVLAVGMYMWMFTGIYDKPAFGIKDYYDASGDKITGQEQVMINDVPGIQYITFQVNALNEDTTDLSVEIIDATPTSLKEKLPMNVKKTIKEGATGSWVSGLVDMTSYEGTDQTFTVTVRATSAVRKEATRTSDLIITIDPDPEGMFSIDLAQGGNDNPGIDPGSDPDPELPPTTSVSFRTTDLSYGSGSAIAYASTCGNTLTKYGYGSVSTSSGYTCEHASGMITKGSQCGANPTKIIATGIGGWVGYTGTVSVWQGTDPTKLCVCQTDADGSGYKFAYYLSTDADASKVSDSSIPTGATEITC